MSTPKSRKLGRLIKTKREGRELTQVKFAELAGISQASVSQWEDGTKTPSLASLFKLRDALGIPPDEFSVWVELAADRGRKSETSAA